MYKRQLQDAGIPSILNLRELQVARSKIATYQRFAQNGIRVPDTMVFFKDSDPETLSGRFGYPFVVKPDSGFGGIGVEPVSYTHLSEKNWNCSECDSFQLNCLVIYIDEKWSLP